MRGAMECLMGITTTHRQVRHPPTPLPLLKVRQSWGALGQSLLICPLLSYLSPSPRQLLICHLITKTLGPLVFVVFS